MAQEEIDRLRRENLFLRGACIKPDAIDDYLRVCRELDRVAAALRAILDRGYGRLKNGYTNEAAIDDILRIARRALDVLPLIDRK